MNANTKDIEVESGYEKQERIRNEEKMRLNDTGDVQMARKKAEAEVKLLAAGPGTGTGTGTGKTSAIKDDKSKGTGMSTANQPGKQSKKDERGKEKRKRKYDNDDTDRESNSSSNSNSDSESYCGGDCDKDSVKDDSGGKKNASRTPTHIAVDTGVGGAGAGAGAERSGSNLRSIYLDRPALAAIGRPHNSDNPPHRHRHRHKKIPKLPDPEFLGCLILAPAEYMKCRNRAKYALHARPASMALSLLGTKSTVSSQINASGSAAAAADKTSAEDVSKALTDIGVAVEYPVITISFNVETVVQGQKEAKEKELISKKMNQAEDDAADTAEAPRVDLFVQKFEKDTETEKFPHNGLILKGKTKGNIMANESNDDGVDGKHVEYNYKGIR